MKIYKINYLLILGVLLFSYNATSAQQEQDIEDRITKIITKMTLEQKIGQLSLRGTSSRTKVLPEELKQDVRDGKVGAFLNVMKVDYVDELQKIAIEESPLGVPLIFSRDIIHGFKTIFPIPIGIAASWDKETAKTSARISAIEGSSYGIRWTFAPMLDIARDSRWGRIAESPGEDPYLASVLAKGYVEGFQTDNLTNPTSMAACAKHFIGYGAAIGGRDYNTAIIHEPLLRNVYLKPFEAALSSGVQTIMTSFNEVNGVPASGNKWLLTDVLRDEMNFDGFVVSDWNSVTEMINHGYAKDEKQAADLAVNAGLDMEMTSKSYEFYVKELIKEGKVKEDQIDFLVRNILRVKFKLGLFEKPYRSKTHTGDLYSEEHLTKAKTAAIKSTVLLKNESVLPLKMSAKIALIGPLANAPREQLGTWTFDGEKEHSVTPLKTFKDKRVSFKFSKGLSYSRDKSTGGFEAAIEAAKVSDVIVFIAGEEAILSGEAHSRANINLPGKQEELIKILAKTGKPIILVIMAGRPITITNIIDDVDAVLMAWHPGTMAGPAIYDILFGKKEPLGRLPVTWPKTAGQLPLFYNHKNTGRPSDAESFVQIDDIPVGAWQSSLGNTTHYLDAGFTPHFPFGYGLGYTTFKLEHLRLSKTEITESEELEVFVSLTNTGESAGEEVVQLYLQDKVGSLTRPVRQLRRFKRVRLNSGETRIVKFIINRKDLEFVNNSLKPVIEKGEFNVYVGQNSVSGLVKGFVLK
ncbi:glycoside hydrolase family 3 N-terminal domain-containing protein [uncultured Lacinutrix sp.]|uniref:glycoside hydrolase family 3 N-terminal domain-containing protein n=1 Tax=uncultured Lacinutrix sp. TaxID=574032 RepID=UPI002614CB2E|nr:glycoside hydrolase family 3 N-terminal domain-containing protein [uncultured Lacinutrix sp.]